MHERLLRISALALFLASSSGCTEEDTASGAGGSGGADAAPEVYSFASRFHDDVSSVYYGGQTMRHLLLEDLTTYIGSLDEAIASSASYDATQVEAGLLSYYEFDSDIRGTDSILLTAEPALLQQIYDDVAPGKDLASKIAGRDDDGRDHRDWSTEFRGWQDASIAAHGGDVTSPDGLVRAFFATIGHQAVLQANGDASRTGLVTYVTPSGQDLQQLVQKFLLGAIAFSQASDDYLDEGLETDNTEPAEVGAEFTTLEHSWDEGFGYFGAARDYLRVGIEKLAAGELVDSDGDGRIDLESEYSFGASVNAAKRDVGSSTGTEFAIEAMTAFLEGRHRIATSESPEALESVAEHAVLAWERAIAATCVHYINLTLSDQSSIGTDGYDFSTHAKHWSELKGFALSFQFNPRSPLQDEEFATLHALLGDAPTLEADGQEALDTYAENLLVSRSLLATAYEFDSTDVENW